MESVKLYFGTEKVCLVTGVLRDKDYTYIAEKLATVAEKAFTFTPDSPRALAASEYAMVLQAAKISAHSADSIKAALECAKEYAIVNNCPIICAGSLYAYAELIDLF